MLTAARGTRTGGDSWKARSDRDYEMAFKTLVERGAGALVVGPFAFRNTNEILALAARYKIPAIYPRRDYVERGGLMSYAADYADTFRQAGIYTGRILKGESPSTSLSCRRRNSNWSSTSTAPRRSALRFRAPCSPSPTR